MPGSVFLDTNVLVYAIESGGPDPAKSATALALARRPDVCLSTQVLGEFYRAVTSPRRSVPLAHEQAVAWVQLWKRHDVRSITVPHVDLALELAVRFRIGYFDALILAAARLAGCEIVYSEDLNDDQDYGGVRVRNPFAG
ncbi:MAG: PIN domain-containing protein [Planctomycetes bacterium]|nr:PIN domain-containing protein [Planctomycetota bacterium]